MSRLQTKCLIASAALHGLLVVVLIVGPAFFVEIKKKETLPILIVIPDKVVDEMLYGGGNPAAQPPAAVQPAAPPVAAPPAPAPVPPQPAPVPPPPKRAEPLPKPEPPPEVKPVPKPADIPKPKTTKAKPEIPKPAAKKPEIKVNIDNVVTHKADDRKERQRREKEKEAAQARAARETYERVVAAQARFAKQQSDRIDAAVSGLRSNLSSGTTVEMPGGFGGPSGPAFANYAQVVKSLYDRAWLAREEILDSRATVDALISVARDGTVLSARITRRSGNPALDKSVQEALNRVRLIMPFPEGATEVERTFKLNFNPQTKRLSG